MKEHSDTTWENCWIIQLLPPAFELERRVEEGIAPMFRPLFAFIAKQWILAEVPWGLQTINYWSSEICRKIFLAGIFFSRKNFWREKFERENILAGKSVNVKWAVLSFTVSQIIDKT